MAEAPGISRADAVAGAVLGAAIGDAMGRPTEFLSLEEIRRRYGPKGVTGLQLETDEAGRPVAPVTDDTQMAEVVLRCLLESRRRGEGLEAAMERIGRGFVAWSHRPDLARRAPGNACLEGCHALERGVPWDQAGGATAGGCGSVMRCYPFGLLFADDPERAERWSVAHSKLTHRDPIALAACAAMARGVAALLQGAPPPEVLATMVAAARRHDAATAAMVERAVHDAHRGIDPEVTLDRLRGWAAHEAIAAAAYLFARHPDDPAGAILEGANTPGDSDSIATLAGALTGARCGLAALPADWVRDVEGAQELLALAREAAGLAKR
ncbi:MAG: ADP-ribosylglycohydrolase family protein [Nitrospirae bacterium]|nr:MAG: ADP-ribosylglycohydrolase family protein [Nitrospirota bacterium]